jgi:hypothetical protein
MLFTFTSCHIIIDLSIMYFILEYILITYELKVLYCHLITYLSNKYLFHK